MATADRTSAPGPGTVPSAIWTKTATDSGLDALKAQREELNGMRTRALAISAIVVTGSAFLVGQGLSTPARDVGFYILAIVGTIGFLALAACIIWVIAPRLEFKFILLPDVLMDWVSSGTNGITRTEEMAQRHLAMDVLPKMLSFNEERLKKVRHRYWVTMIVGFLTLTVWIAVVWIYA